MLERVLDLMEFSHWIGASVVIVSQCLHSLGTLPLISQRYLHSICDLCTVAASSLVTDSGIVICSLAVTGILDKPGIESGNWKVWLSGPEREPRGVPCQPVRTRQLDVSWPNLSSMCGVRCVQVGDHGCQAYQLALFKSKAIGSSYSPFDLVSLIKPNA